MPCAPVAEVPEVIDNPQVQARQMLFDMEYPGLGTSSWRRYRSKPRIWNRRENVRAPLLGEHTEEILAEARL